MQAFASSSSVALCIEDFSPLIKKKIKQVRTLNQTFDKDDLKQELTMKLLSNLNNLNQEAEKEGKGYAFAKAKAILNNKIIDIKKYYSNRPDCSQNTLPFENVKTEDEEPKNQSASYNDFDRNLLNCILTYSDQTAFDFYAFRQLKKLILDWVVTQDEKTKQFIRESVAPSKGLRGSRFAKNTPHMRADYLHISDKKRNKILFNLAQHLVKNGYESNVLDICRQPV